MIEFTKIQNVNWGNFFKTTPDPKYKQKIIYDTKIEIKDKKIYIYGINYKLFKTRIKRRMDKHILKMFNFIYNENDLRLYNDRNINSIDKLDIECVYINEFFAMETRSVFIYLYSIFHTKQYKIIIDCLEKETYLNKILIQKDDDFKNYERPISKNTINEFKDNPLMNHQVEFITKYPSFKYRLNLRGFILSFDQGLGKTMTGLGLSINLEKEQTLIICPNSVRNVWLNELLTKIQTYKSDKNKAIQDIYCHNCTDFPEFKTSKNPKFIIVNNEAVDKIEYLLNYNKKTLIIIDECQNFRYLDGIRFSIINNIIQKMFSIINYDLDVLCMSGTPIKAKPSELAASLTFIDPLFDEDTGNTFIKAFSLDTIAAGPIIDERFGRVIYRKLKKETIQLPEKHLMSAKFELTNSEKYTIKNVMLEVDKVFNEVYKDKIKNIKQYGPRYERIVDQYSSAPNYITREYLHYLRKKLYSDESIKLHELDKELYKTFDDVYVIPNIKNVNLLKEFKEIQVNYNKCFGSAKGIAMGRIVPKYRTQLFIDIIHEHSKDLISIIKQADKKTILFTSCKGVIPELEKMCSLYGLSYRTITGDNPKERDSILDKFKLDDSIDVLIATNQTLYTGVTLTCANIEIIFGPPWRKADLDQMCDRIHRIGQDTECFIYNVELITGNETNIATRMSDIMIWSGKMTDRYIDGIFNS